MGSLLVARCSLLEELARREAAARRRIEEIREQIAALTSQLQDEQDRLSRLTITRETVEEIPGEAAQLLDEPNEHAPACRRVTTNNTSTSNVTTSAEDTPSPVYSSMLSLSTKTLTFLADLLRGHLKTIGSRRRKLPRGRSPPSCRPSCAMTSAWPTWPAATTCQPPLALTDTRGNLLWLSAARHHDLPAKLRDAGLAAIADLGFVGLDDDPANPAIITGKKAARNKPLTTAQKQVNQLISVERAPVEHGFADLKGWRILTKLRLDPTEATELLRALLVLTHHQTTR